MNYKNEDEQNIKKLFHLIKEENLRITPSFLKDWEIASSKVGRGIGRTSFLKIAAACAVLIMFGITALILWNERMVKPQQDISISEWKAPTDFLLKTPGAELLKTIPQLGESLEEKNRRRQ